MIGWLLHSTFFFCGGRWGEQRWSLDCYIIHSAVCLPQIESMMLKLHRLQQKAILDDDYDAGELQTFRLLLVVIFNPLVDQVTVCWGNSFLLGVIKLS